MKSLLLGLSALLCVSAATAETELKKVITCEQVKEAKAQDKVTRIEFECADDKACLTLEKQQITWAMTSTFEEDGEPKTEISDELYEAYDKSSDGAYKEQLQIGDLILDGANLGLGGGDTTVVHYFETGTTNPVNVYYYSSDIYINNDFCTSGWTKEEEEN